MLGLFSFVHAGSIGDIQLRFCQTYIDADGNKEIQYVKHLETAMDIDKEQDLCMKITNLSKDPMTIDLGFVDGTVTTDSDHRKACKDEGQNSQFGKFVSWDHTSISLAPGQSVEKHAQLKFDARVGGEILGCVTYFQAGALEKKSNGMLRILVRKANFITVYLSGDVQANLLWLT
ncbi:MAG: hypothetical protein GXP45_05245 [bacterium]|nr:hypothetical protein [bacterium]